MSFRTNIIYSSISILVLTLFFFFLQYSKLLSISGIQPNIILVFPLFLLFKERSSFPFFVSIFSSALYLYFFSPFWILPVSFTIILALFVFFFRSFFTGNHAFDFFGVVAITTIIFLLTLYAFHWGDISVPVMLGSIIYNMLIGGIFLLISSKVSFS